MILNNNVFYYKIKGKPILPLYTGSQLDKVLKMATNFPGDFFSGSQMWEKVLRQRQTLNSLQVGQKNFREASFPSPLSIFLHSPLIGPLHLSFKMSVLAYFSQNVSYRGYFQELQMIVQMVKKRPIMTFFYHEKDSDRQCYENAKPFPLKYSERFPTKNLI